VGLPIHSIGVLPLAQTLCFAMCHMQERLVQVQVMMLQRCSGHERLRYERQGNRVSDLDDSPERWLVC